MDRIGTVKRLVLLVALGVVTGDGRGQTSKMKPDAAPATPGSSVAASGVGSPAAAATYIIGPDDVLAVNVWKEPELSRSVIVRPDGKITLPLLKDIEASGSTPEQLQERIEKGLSDYVSKPVVTVILQEEKSHKFNVLGQVQKPGSYLLNSPMTVLDAIAMAGGFREWAKVNSIYVLRETSPGIRKKLPFHYNEVVKGSGPDVQLQTKDTVVVP
jgi:polysaccharide export outer membrane protein